MKNHEGNEVATRQGILYKYMNGEFYFMLNGVWEVVEFAKVFDFSTWEELNDQETAIFMGELCYRKNNIWYTNKDNYVVDKNCDKIFYSDLRYWKRVI